MDHETPIRPPVLLTGSALTLRFFHQYLRLSLAALVSNWEAPAWSASARSSSSDSFWSRSRTLSTFTLMMSTTWRRRPQGRGCAKAHLNEGTPGPPHAHIQNLHPDVARLTCQGHKQNMSSIPEHMQEVHIGSMLIARHLRCQSSTLYRVSSSLPVTTAHLTRLKHPD